MNKYDSFFLYNKQLYLGLHSTHPSFLLSRLIEQYKNQERLIIAYDFDDTVKPYWCSSCEDVKSVLRLCKDVLNAYFIVYTCNTNHDKIREYLTEEEIPFDTINQNAPFINTSHISGKLFYNVFLEDKAGLGEVVKTLEELCYLVGNNKI